VNTPDPRFFEPLGPVGLAEIAAAAGAVCPPTAADLAIASVSILALAGAGQVTYFSDRRYAQEAAKTGAAACFVTAAAADALPAGCVGLVTPAPQAAWTAAATRLHRPRRFDANAPAVHPTAELEEGVEICPGAVVGAHAQIGAGTVIGPGAAIGPGVAIGRRCVIGANVSVSFALIGDGVRLLANCAIGEAGFGVAVGASGLVDAPQLGRVILQDNVTIGACSCVDRGAFEDTVVGENTKIDNLVMIAHNVRVGRNCVMAAHTGISGSVTIGDGAMLGGRVGIKDHIDVGAGAQLGANSGVMHDVPAGQAWGGFPAQPVKQWLREVGWLRRAVHRGGGRGGEA
jgi:UDP-3-O-[3-hydroxymyristoyl] glucosamine N-acyltransferase